MNPIHPQDGFVYVPIRSQRVEEVFQYMAQPAIPRPMAGATEHFKSLPRDEQLTALYAMVREPHRAILEALASQPNRWVATQDLAKALGLSNPRSLSGLLGSFSAIKRRFGDLEPWMSRWSSPDRSTFYFMNAEDAAVIRSAQREAEADASSLTNSEQRPQDRATETGDES